MAITKCLHMKQAKTGYPAKHLANGLRYIMNPEKTEHGRYVCGHNCIPEQALSQMVDTKRHFGKLDKRQGYHFILSFEEDEVSEEEAFQVVGEFVTEFLGKDFEAVYAVHNDTDHIHGHIIFNSVRCTTGYKYDIPDNTEKTFRNLGISHVLAVSGLHVSLVSGILFALLRVVFKMRKRTAAVPTAIFLTAYFIFTGKGGYYDIDCLCGACVL